MSAPNTAGWVRLGLLLLPIYGVLTFIGTFTHQPDPNTDFEAYARYLSTTSYLVQHLVCSIFGLILGILGAIALGIYLADGRSGRLALFAMVASVAGSGFVLTIFGFSTIISPVIGQLYLAGHRGVIAVNEAIFSSAAFGILAVPGLLLSTASTILFGIAIWHSGTLPKWAGVLYAPTGFLISIVGLQIGQAQTLGTALLIAATVWICWSVLHQAPSTPTVARVRPRVS